MTIQKTTTKPKEQVEQQPVDMPPAPQPKIHVKVGQFGRETNELELPEGSTVEDALKAADIDIKNNEVRISNTKVDVKEGLKEGDLLMIVPQVSGG